MTTSGWLDTLRRDLKFTRRVLTKNRSLTTTAIVTLALGITASTVIYTVVDAVLLQPLDYQDSGDIYRVYTVDAVGLPRGATGPPHLDPIADDEGDQIEAAFFGFSFEQSVVNDAGTAFAVNEFRASDEFFDDRGFIRPGAQSVAHRRDGRFARKLNMIQRKRVANRTEGTRPC